MSSFAPPLRATGGNLTIPSIRHARGDTHNPLRWVFFPPSSPTQKKQRSTHVFRNVERFGNVALHIKTSMKVIAALFARTRGMGRDGRLPWHIPEDWEYFSRRTQGAICIAGRRSLESWPSPLGTFDASTPRRLVVVSTRLTSSDVRSMVARQHHDALPLAIAGDLRPFIRVAKDFASAVAIANTAWKEQITSSTTTAAAECSRDTVWVCGGARIYEEAIVHPRTSMLELTLVEEPAAGCCVECDVFFPEWRGADRSGVPGTQWSVCDERLGNNPTEGAVADPIAPSMTCRFTKWMRVRRS